MITVCEQHLCWLYVPVDSGAWFGGVASVAEDQGFFSAYAFISWTAMTGAERLRPWHSSADMGNREIE